MARKLIVTGLLALGALGVAAAPATAEPAAASQQATAAATKHFRGVYPTWRSCSDAGFRYMAQEGWRHIDCKLRWDHHYELWAWN